MLSKSRLAFGMLTEEDVCMIGKTILIVDDEENIRHLIAMHALYADYQGSLRKVDTQVKTLRMKL